MITRPLVLSSVLIVCSCLALAGCSPHSGDATMSAPFSSNSPRLLPVKVSAKWGYVSEKGQLVITPQFDDAERFSEDRAVVCIGKPCDWFAKPGDSRWGFIDTAGKMVVTPQYGAASGFKEGLASVCSGDG